MYTCLLDKFLATQGLQECHITTSMVQLYDFEFQVMVDLSSLWSLGLRIGQLTTSDEWLVSGVHHAAGSLTSRFRNHTIFSNLSSFFTLCIDLRRSVRKTPAFSMTKHFMPRNIWWMIRNFNVWNQKLARIWFEGSNARKLTCTNERSICKNLTALVAEGYPEV